ncbi:hypothetical protein HYALB_00012459 [Hymenoscyphus albidus]|uniref:Uncharacterized protein n=1 Tax=Hymenoscyphus albidus TaxID=595503 RepID=A0A9N9LLE2_9HELO|nr:hypothetical protein HYALB_00012459 [Hymenoscyphus albidus]
MNTHTNKNAILQEKQRKAERDEKLQERIVLHDATDEAENSDSWSEDQDSALEAWYSSFSWSNNDWDDWDDWEDISDSSDECDRFIYADSTEDEYSAEDTYWSQVDNPEFQNEDGVSGDDQYTEDGFLSSGHLD